MGKEIAPTGFCKKCGHSCHYCNRLLRCSWQWQSETMRH